MNDHSGKLLKIALIGNPNSGKSTVFNQLTGLRQKTGNFPGVTVDMKEGRLRFPSGFEATLIDLPGTYSLYPTSSDEKIVTTVLTNPQDDFYPDALVYVADATNLEKHLLLFTQLLDLDLPIVLALNMSDTAAEAGIKVNTTKLAERFSVPVVSISGRTGENIQKLLHELEKLLKTGGASIPPFYPLRDSEKQVSDAVQLNLSVDNPYRALLLAHHHSWLPFLPKQERETLAAIVQTKNFQSLKAQVDETLDRFDRFTPIVRQTILQPSVEPATFTDRIDAFLTHRWFGPLIFFGVMLLVFMAIFFGYDITGGWVENGTSAIVDIIGNSLPDNWFASLLTKGVLPGLQGVLVFVPQIALLFLLITILEEVGYMARAVFIFDKTMRRFGMNGRSIVALIGGGACAVPAIMGTRTISNWKERLITVMVTPFISCSARIPVYLVLIPVALPASSWWTKALIFGGMYFFGLTAALGAAFVFKKILRTSDPSYLALELPVYRMPHWKNVWLTVWEKVKAFIGGAGKIILYISIALWILGNSGPSGALENAENNVRSTAAADISQDSLNDMIAAKRLEASFAGIIGKTIEPAILPLGYDWKIGIALLSSFAAREVFNGTMYTIYSLESVAEIEESEAQNQRPFERYGRLRQQMASDTFDNGQHVYTLATGISLLIFYALAMQCMSTLAVVRRETGSWKWPVFQFLFMSGLAYLCAWLAYTFLPKV
ncbi:MAG: ferrous iron transport protein B [Haliscomenobacteraceae bacterium CHB4]|nr:Fe(2+) transporter FeoB [Saprospiraceae bacterium]MCE7924331.1 ferrous iron transport protein B [Haliscomenobacteraceae bacterium CHB4]